jgi:hypothetical protein
MLPLPEGPEPPRGSTVPWPSVDVELLLKNARAYLLIGPSTRISPGVTALGDRPHARSEITIGPPPRFRPSPALVAPLAQAP